jgi:SAM-dependent methyltransferase
VKVEVTRLNKQDVVWWTDERDKAERLLKAKGLPWRELNRLWDEFSWKMRFVPPDARRVLSIGCGDGAELLFLRLRAPNATIHAIDWADTLSPEIRNLDGIAFSVHDLANLEELPNREFDLIFSNHVIEHFYEPDRIVSDIRNLLAPGGIFVSALPLDGHGDVGFKDLILKLLKSKNGFGATDGMVINFGHPWKTNFSDLKQTLEVAGFIKAEFFQREWSVTRHMPYSDEERREKLAMATLLHSAIVRPAQNFVKALFGLNPPVGVTRVFEAFERRVFFGSNRICSDLAMETLFVARN